MTNLNRDMSPGRFLTAGKTTRDLRYTGSTTVPMSYWSKSVRKWVASKEKEETFSNEKHQQRLGFAEKYADGVY